MSNLPKFTGYVAQELISKLRNEWIYIAHGNLGKCGGRLEYDARCCSHIVSKKAHKRLYGQIRAKTNAGNEKNAKQCFDAQVGCFEEFHTTLGKFVAQRFSYYRLYSAFAATFTPTAVTCALDAHIIGVLIRFFYFN
jgi:hypothetical protein